MSIKVRNIQESVLVCSNIDDLAVALREISDAPPDTEIEFSIHITIPGIGLRVVKLLDEVPVTVRWRTATQDD